jgi:tetratricopeptide (TPR) repeat protein
VHDGSEILNQEAAMEKTRRNPIRLIGLIGLVGLIGFISLIGPDAAHAEKQLGVNLSYSDARVYNNKGVDLVSQAKYQEAAGEFQNALTIDPDFHVARYNLALAYYNMGRVKDAISEFEYLTNSSYYFVNARYNLGTIYLREGMIDKALEQLKIVIELQPNHAEAHFNIGFIYFKKNMWPEAITEYKKGLEIEPDSIKGHMSLAFIYEKNNKYKEAIGEYSLALDFNPDHQESLQALGGVKAIVQIQESLKKAPNDSRAYLDMGHIYYARGMYKEAIDCYQQVLQYDSQNDLAKTCVKKAIEQLSASEDTSPRR